MATIVHNGIKANDSHAYH